MASCAISKQVAQLWRRDRTSPTILRGWVTLSLNFRLKGYVSRQYLWTVKYGNVSAGSFHTNKLGSGLYLTEIEFYSINKKSLTVETL